MKNYQKVDAPWEYLSFLGHKSSTEPCCPGQLPEVVGPRLNCAGSMVAGVSRGHEPGLLVQGCFSFGCVTEIRTWRAWWLPSQMRRPGSGEGVAIAFMGHPWLSRGHKLCDVTK